MAWTRWERRLPLYSIAVGLILVSFAGWLGHRGLNSHYRNGQAHTTARLLAATSVPRVMDAPGVEAWIRDMFEQAMHDLPSAQKLAYSRIVDRGDASDLLWFGEPLTNLLADAELPNDHDELYAQSIDIQEDLRSSELVYRTVGILRGQTPVVVTRRRTLSYGLQSAYSDSFVSFSAKLLHSLSRNLSEPDKTTGRAARLNTDLEQVPWFLGMSLRRLYTVSEDGTFVSLPMDTNNKLRFVDEVAECRSRAHSPSFVTNEFIFDVNYGSDDSNVPRYSGIYLDTAGAGFVGTLVRPIVETETGVIGALAADVAFDIDIELLFKASGNPIDIAIAENVMGANEGFWQPWSALRAGIGPSASTKLHDLLQSVAERETRQNIDMPRRPIYHHANSATGDTVFALQISKERWLVARVFAGELHIPWFEILTIPFLFVGLVVIVEGKRRRALHNADLAKQELARLHALLITEELPLQAEEIGSHIREKVELARQDERDRLAAILNHGVDTLARILSFELSPRPTENSDSVCLEFCGWLAEYLLRRIHVTQWTLENWGSGSKFVVLSSLEASQIQAAATVYSNINRLVRARPDLRARLHWNNGILSAPADEYRGDSVHVWLDWPSDWLIGLPEEGVFGFVFGELMVNAIKYGAPGSAIEVTAQFNPARKEVRMCIANDVVQSDESTRLHGRRYGGLAIVQELAQLCGWHDFATQFGKGRFQVTWTCAAVRRRRHDAVD